MARTYRNNWPAKKNFVNFNKMEWRQDLASFIHDELYWSATRVTRSKILSGKTNKDAVRQFSIYNADGNSIEVKYKSYNNIIYSSNKEIITKYLNLKGKI